MPELVRTVGRYGITRELGRGGMAVVYLARQLDLDRLVALKELAAFHAADADFARRFVRESRLAGSLVHPNVITVFDYFEHAGTPYIAMEYVERGSLRPYVGKITLAQIGGVLEGLLAGLAAAEQLAIVHRDLKPENLMVAADGSVKIADFGIAKATQATETNAFVTATGTTVGTPPYMAPEQAMAKEVGPWTDLYSVGCMAYELFTGRPPFYDTGEPLAILLRHISEPLPPASEVADVDADISGWIDRLTAKVPEQRPQSATAAWEELEEILIAKLGPRWRRESRLPEPPGPPADDTVRPQTSSVWREEMAGIDLEGTGPDTPEGLPVAETAYETYAPPPSGPPAAEPAPPAQPPAQITPPPAVTPPPVAPAEATPAPAATPPADPPAEAKPPVAVHTPTVLPQQPAPPPPEERDAAPASGDGPPVPPRVVLLARAGAGGVLAALLIAVLASGPDRWNLFAVLSPFEAVGIAVAAWAVARALSSARMPLPVAAGALVGLGTLTLIAAVALLRFTINRLDAPSTVLAVVVLLAAVALLAAGAGCLRATPAGEAAAPVDPAALVLGLVGTALACVALFVKYDGFSSLWSEVGDGESAEFFFEPAVAAGAMLAGLVLLGARPRFAAALLLTIGSATALHHLGVIFAAWRAIGEVGDIRAAGFIGVLGGLLVAAAGAWAARPLNRR